tara:strand:- start:801 stop:1091 length:291 start_codon:yes stop_codon:yes gene_type:complete
MDIEKMHAEGKSQRSIAACTGASVGTVNGIVGVQKLQTALIEQSELEGEPKTQTAQMAQDEVHQKTRAVQTDETIQSEEPTSVFTHATSETLMSLS